ncbi:MAG: GspH/FimT family pseudopilin [Bdellovibrio bacteriovorus]
MHIRPRKARSGVTLIELLVTLSVVAILLTLGVAGFRTLIANAKMTNAANSLIGHLQFARSEAVKRSAEVGLCPSTNGTSCVVSGDGSWEIGYIAQLEGSGQVLRWVEPSEMAGITITKSGTSPRIVFKGDGSASGYACTFTLCDLGDSDHKRGVVVSNVGRVRISDYSASGGALTCP